MPLPLIPIAAGALLAGGSKIAASLADRKADKIAEEVRDVEDRVRRKNLEYEPLREKWSQEFSLLANAEKARYDQFVLETCLSAEEIDSAEITVEVRAAIGSLRISPPPIIDLSSCKQGDDMMRHGVYHISRTLQHTNPQKAAGARNLAMFGAVAGYVHSNFSKVAATDAYEGKARAYIAEVSKIVEAFDAAFDQDLQEDLRTSQKNVEFVHELVQKSLQGSAPDRQLQIVSGHVYKEVVQYLFALSERYSVPSPKGNS
ncbi:MAG: hypothetical protein V7K68_05935 [Nostoc sp.]|uniref:hypothetical protein n=1 Tax=Nostoc sp. TaxID=1180 RepID=UPI002FF5EC8F